MVATGTGSGKTEVFLVPILNHLFQQLESNSLNPGVRALLLYPMNALANDQMMRMRDLLKNIPEITFGRFTGETKREDDEALTNYRKMYRQDPLINELISRDQMRKSPPHILLTNYAMLEYLMLRPSDNVFFDGEYANQWKYLVVDEAHTYAGAKGIEMAMLIRRLKEEVVGGVPGKLKCIATSATLGKGESDFPQVADFAKNLFGEEINWDVEDSSQQDVVRAVRKPMNELKFGQIDIHSNLYLDWLEAIESTKDKEIIDDLYESGLKHGISNEMLSKCKMASNGDIASFLFEILKRDSRISRLRRILEEEPRYIKNLTNDLFDENDNSYSDKLIGLVELAATARPDLDEQPLIPARYHLFVRAIEGAYLAFQPVRKLYLERHERILANDKYYPVFEIATCRQCGATYLVGEETGMDGRVVLKQPGKKYYESTSNLEYYLLLDGDIDPVQENEDEIVSYGERLDIGERHVLCTSCGAIDRATLFSSLCDCDEKYHLDVVKVPSKGGKVHKCPACARQSPTGLVWRFLTGTDATASVLASALYQNVPPRKVSRRKETPTEDSSDDWSSTINVEMELGRDSELSGQGRQLLIFSDSRQNAAFFAPYLNRTYSQILRRRLILKTLADHSKEFVKNRWRVQDLVNPLQTTISDLNLYPEKSLQGKKNEAWKWILYELLSIDSRNSLEGLGCLGFSLVKPTNWNPPTPLLNWGLNEEEVWTLFQVLLDTLRKKGAILFPDYVSPEDEFFKPRNREYFFRGNGSNPKRHISSWSPSAKHALNSRLDYLLRLTNKGLGIKLNKEHGIRILNAIWKKSLALQAPTSCWHDYFSGVSLPREGVVYRLKHNYWKLQPDIIDPESKWYYCDTCHNLTLYNIRGTCPTYRCGGKLHRCEPDKVFADNHYRRLYMDLKPIKLLAEEHTAQLTSRAAADLQSKFIQGEVNVLSCSTTFELGVDVGQLETVFMRNVPPSAANYVQRAGRAGRRTESTAFALTFAQRRSHDLSHFNHPKDMVAGDINAPHFKIANEKIVKRHIFATALSHFWKHHPETFKNVEAFFWGEDKNGPEKFYDYLSTRPDDLAESIDNITPNSLKRTLKISDWGWVDGLFDEQEGVLTLAEDEVQDDINVLQKARQKLIDENKPSDFILRRIQTIQRRYLINHLSSRNVIPKYGFPVDVVELEVWHHADEAKNLELDRDLKIALSEYAPSSQVVAGGKLWTSRYLKKVADREWPRYRYAICDYCHYYQRVLPESDEQLKECPACGQPLGRNRGIFIIPEFGFITSNDPPKKPGETRPERTYTTRTYYSGESESEEGITLNFKGMQLTATPASEGKMAVINHAGYQGFSICSRCGYALLGNENTPATHRTPWGSECDGELFRGLRLGHEFKTDILQLKFTKYANDIDGFWLSLLYAILEGASEELDIDRRDLNGCLYPYAGDPTMPAIIIFDEVPGGAGHVKRIVKDTDTLMNVFKAAKEKLEGCTCGGDEANTSCYGCLRNYQNQFCHEILNRGLVIDFIKSELNI